MPTELFDLYETIMSRITQFEDDSKQLALQTLSWVLYAKRPLQMDELREATAIEEGDRGLDKEDLPPAKTLVEVCGSFIIHDQYSGVVGLSHETVKEFLILRHSRQLILEVGIAKMCLTYLLFDVFNDPCTNSNALDARVRKYRLSRYAAQFWCFHTRGKAESCSHIQDAVLSLLTAENKTQSMLQMEEYKEYLPNGGTLLHVIAAKGLVTMCKLVLDQMLNHRRYTLPTRSMLIDRNGEGLASLVPSFSAVAETTVFTEDNTGCTALYRAAEKGHDEVVQLLLENGADVNAQGGFCENALQVASDLGHDAVVKTLLDNGANVNAVGIYGTALQAASLHGYEVIVRLLLDYGADVNDPGASYSNALLSASFVGHVAVVKALLDNGADVNALWKDGFNAISAASDGGHEAVVRLLLDNGADVNAHRERDCTALWVASLRGHEAVVQMLLDNGADVKVRGATSAIRAASFGGHEAVVRVLLNHGANVNVDTLVVASVQGREAAVRLLLDNAMFMADLSAMPCKRSQFVAMRH
jgi:ankyrin repeat protein